MNCYVCGKPMTQWYEDEKGRRVCSMECRKSLLPKCSVCSKPMEKWYVLENGEKVCSDNCRRAFLPKCDICGIPMEEWIQTEDGKKVCSQKCLENLLPKCDVCGKPMKSWTETEDGRRACSRKCFEEFLPKCDFCGKPMQSWIEYDDGKKFCSTSCRKNDLSYSSYDVKHELENGGNQEDSCEDAFKIKRSMTAAELSYVTNLPEEDCNRFMQLNGFDGDEAMSVIDRYIEAVEDEEKIPVHIESALKKGGIYEKLNLLINSFDAIEKNDL